MSPFRKVFFTAKMQATLNFPKGGRLAKLTNTNVLKSILCYPCEPFPFRGIEGACVFCGKNFNFS